MPFRRNRDFKEIKVYVKSSKRDYMITYVYQNCEVYPDSTTKYQQNPNDSHEQFKSFKIQVGTITIIKSQIEFYLQAT